MTTAVTRALARLDIAPVGLTAPDKTFEMGPSPGGASGGSCFAQLHENLSPRGRAVPKPQLIPQTLELFHSPRVSPKAPKSALVSIKAPRIPTRLLQHRRFAKKSKINAGGNSQAGSAGVSPFCSLPTLPFQGSREPPGLLEPRFSTGKVLRNPFHANPWVGGRGRLLSKPAASGSQPAEFPGFGGQGAGGTIPEAPPALPGLPGTKPPKLKEFQPHSGVFCAWQKLDNIVIV